MTPAGFRHGRIGGKVVAALVTYVEPRRLGVVITAEVQDWLDAGSSVVWVVDPHTNTVSVHQGRGEGTILRSGDTLTGGELIPGLRIEVAELFAT